MIKGHRLFKTEASQRYGIPWSNLETLRIIIRRVENRIIGWVVPTRKKMMETLI